jgi:hypothetical protein
MGFIAFHIPHSSLLTPQFYGFINWGYPFYSTHSLKMGRALKKLLHS